MASQPKPTRKRDKIKSFLRNITPHSRASTSNIAATQPPPSPIPPQSSSDNVAPTAPNAPAIPPPRVAPQKAFVKTKVFEKDIAVLWITYILADNPELKRLIHLIVGIHDKDEDDQLNGVLETCARFGVQLASAIEAHNHRAEATESITEFIKTVEKVNLEQGVLSVDALKRMVEDEITQVKSSHPIFAHDSDFGALNRLSNVLNTTIGAGITILGVVKVASAMIPVPWMQTVIGGVVNLLNAVTQTRSNYDDMRQIAATAGEFVISCAVICSDRTTEPSKELKRALNKFTKTLEGIAKDCDELSGLNPFWRYLQNNVQKGTLQGIRTNLDSAIKLFQIESQIHMQLDVKDISMKLDDATLNSLPNHPKYRRNEYLGGSRDDVLRYISGWMDTPNDPILWIHGAAGLGKSTIGQQLVHLLEDDDRLAGGVFLSNLPKEHPETIIQMISRQLGEMHPRAIADIAKAARKLNGPHRPLQDYFTAYIIAPIHQLEYPYQLVVVIDGVEEWSNHEAFLTELAALAPILSSSSLKFILTSRPSHSIERILTKIPVQQYPLPPVSDEIIEHYFTHHFENVDWRARKPDQFTIRQLATHAQGLLIWAATVRSLLSHEFDDRYPHQILDQILLSEEKVGTRSGEQLERLYRDAITTLFPKPDMQEKLQIFLGAMMVLQEPLPLGDFARLLGMSDRVAEETHRRLTAFQTRGQINNGIVPPANQQFHISFLQFMESTTEHNVQSIAISPAKAHSMLADRCLKIIFSEFLPSYRGKTCVYSELRGVELYTIKFWPLHLSNGTSRLLLAPSITGTLTAIPDEDMLRWATLFLPCIAARLRDEHESLDNDPKYKLLFKLAIIIGNIDVTTLSYQLYCLEIAVRLRPMNLWIWIVLGGAYNKLYKYSRHNKSLDEEISICRHALQLRLASRKSAGEGLNADIARDTEGQTNTSGTDHLGVILTSLASALFVRFEQRGAPSDLDEAISINQEALLLRPAPHPDRSSSVNNLAAALYTRFQQQGASCDLDEAISFFREALLLRPAPHPDYSMSLNNLGNALHMRFEQRGAPSDLDEAILSHREALFLRPAPHPEQSMSLNNLAIALHTRFAQRGASSDLDEVISIHREALLLQPAPHPVHPMSLSNLAGALITRFQQRGASDSSDLDEAISLYQEVLLLWPAPHPNHPTLLSNLALALHTRFEQRGAPSDLDKAVLFHREALLLQPASHPDHSRLLCNLGDALLTRFEQRGASSDLDEAILLYREVLLLRPAPHPNRSTSLSNICNALQTRFERQNASSDIDEAISLHRERLALHPAPHPDHPVLLANLAEALQTRFRHSSVINDLDEAISLRQEVLVLYAAPHESRSWVLDGLVEALQTRFEKQNASSDIDEVISLHRERLALHAVPHPDHPVLLADLAEALQARFGHSSIMSDLDEAILLWRQVLALLPAPHQYRSWALNGLADALQTRFEKQSASSDIDEAILLHREGLALHPAPHPDHPALLADLAEALQARFGHSSIMNDLDEAISLWREVLVLHPAPHEYRTWALTGLADALQTRFEKQGTISDRDEVTSLRQEAEALSQ
ncbi:tetratricopeptide repeat-containing protein [Pholiota molesta]|nr:tetratricopeptide repeat-containing protein [Pholiota molesta]